MVEKRSDQIQTHQVPLQYTIQEQLLLAKTGHEEDCEDAIYIGSHFVAVIDGATSKTSRRWNGQTGGRVGALAIREAFGSIPYDATARQAVDIVTTVIQQIYEQHQVTEVVESDPVQRITASFVAVSLWRKEVWFVGDCQCLFDQEHVTNLKEVDQITSQARSLFLEAEIVQGKTIDQLRHDDTGRAFILPLLEQQMVFQNNPSAGQYWFAVLDGFPIPDEGIRVCSLPTDTTTIVLASDGYPAMKETLVSSEQALQELLREDPLLFRKYKSTKGVTGTNISYDDRAYVKLLITR